MFQCCAPRLEPRTLSMASNVPSAARSPLKALVRPREKKCCDGTTCRIESGLCDQASQALYARASRRLRQHIDALINAPKQKAGKLPGGLHTLARPARGNCAQTSRSSRRGSGSHIGISRPWLLVRLPCQACSCAVCNPRQAYSTPTELQLICGHLRCVEGLGNSCGSAASVSWSSSPSSCARL